MRFIVPVYIVGVALVVAAFWQGHINRVVAVVLIAFAAFAIALIREKF